MLETNYQPGMAQTRTQGNAMPDPIGAGGYQQLMDSFIQKRLSAAQGAPQAGGPIGVGGSMRRGDQSRNRATEGQAILPKVVPSEDEQFYAARNSAMTPVTGFNMGGGYTMDPNKLPPRFRPQNAGMIPGSAVPTGSIQSPDMQMAAGGRGDAGGEYAEQDGRNAFEREQLAAYGGGGGQQRPIDRPRAGRAPAYR